MIQLLQVIGEHLQAVERDLIVAGLHFYDIGTPKLSWVELESFVMAAPPGTTIHTSRTNGWNRDYDTLEMLRASAKPSRAPVQQRPMSARDGRGRNLMTHDPNKEVTALLGKVVPFTIEEFKARQAAKPKADQKAGA